MANILTNGGPSDVIEIANKVLKGGFDEFPDLMYETIYVFSGSNGRCRCVAKIDVEVEGYRIEVVDRPWFERHGAWLAAIAPEKEWPRIFEAFNACDWRYGECGGCI